MKKRQSGRQERPRPTDAGSDPLSSPPARVPGRFRGWRGWLLRLALLLLAPVLFFGSLEAGLRLAGYGYPAGFFIRSEGDRSMTNYRFGWRFFPRSLARDPHPCVISAKPSNTVRIFVLGSSAAMGTPDPAFSFGRILEVMLREQFPGLRFEVVNAAMTAINSHVALEIARDCAAFEPDLFVVYLGNNEVVGPFGPGTVFQRWTPSLRLIRANLRVKATRAGQLLTRVAGLFRRDENIPHNWRGMEMFLNNPVSADDPRMDAVYGNYRCNLDDLCDVARHARAGVVLANVAVNLRDCPPFASSHRAGLSPAELSKWEAGYKAGCELQLKDRLPEALAQYEVAAGLDDCFAELQFRIGQCLLAGGRIAEAQDRFARARDLDTLRFRADSRIQEIIKGVAEGRKADGVCFADAERALSESASESLGGSGADLFYEHVHLTFDGNYLLARSVLDQVCASLPQLAASGRQGAVPSRQRCAELLALTPWDESQLVADMVEMTSKAPFTNQLDHRTRQADASRRRDELHALASTQEAMQTAWKTYEAALAQTPDDWQMHHHFGKLAMQMGRPDVAVEQFRIVVQRVPLDASLHVDLGNALAAQGPVNEAIAQYQRALKIKPDAAEAHYNLGVALASLRRDDEAISHYQKALKNKPDYAEAHYMFGIVLASRKQADEAIAHFQQALKIKPDYAEAHTNLGHVLAGRGRVDEAVAHFQQALKIKPNVAESHYNLGVVLASRKQGDEAIARFQQAVKIKPDYAEAHYNLGVALASRRRVDEAITHFQQALKIKPDVAEAHYNLGIALASLRRGDEAIAHYQKALDIKPDYAEAHNNLGVALAGRGRTDEAIVHFQRALKINPGDVNARQNLELARPDRAKSLPALQSPAGGSETR